MALLTRITDDKAEGQVAEIFASLTAAVGEIPQPLRMLAGSPGLFMQQMGLIGYYRSHPRLDPLFQVLIRFHSAKKLDYQACVDFNGSLLRRQGMSETELAAIQTDPAKSPLSDREKALLDFVIKAVDIKEKANPSDMSGLKELGWLESDIIDATYLGVGMMVHGRMLGFFRMAE